MGESEAPGGGGGIGLLIENPRERGGFQRGADGARRVSAANWGILGTPRRAEYFFSGLETSAKFLRGRPCRGW